ncbi:unnamed protein product [Schistocephalus solidus]|uniref:Uncharacterized protein n=1 Tax=Schistocephalus solidus TaxID=70667 RepID=A0A183TT01_SCHSO|nr:unnamed protein product [Schistocephalus solidus]
MLGSCVIASTRSSTAGGLVKESRRSGPTGPLYHNFFLECSIQRDRRKTVEELRQAIVRECSPTIEDTSALFEKDLVSQGSRDYRVDCMDYALAQSSGSWGHKATVSEECNGARPSAGSMSNLMSTLGHSHKPSLEAAQPNTVQP